MSETMDDIYQAGFDLGVTGVRQRCPDEYFHDTEHSRRDRWIEGYRVGYREFKKRLRGYDKSAIQNEELAKGKLHFDPKDQYGYQAVRDGENGTILCKLKIDGEVRILVPKANVTPEQAMFISRAIAKAAGFGYKMRVSRELRPQRMDELKVAPTIPKDAPLPGWDRRSDRLMELHNLARRLQSNFKTWHWHVRKGQDSDLLPDKIRADLDALEALYQRFMAGDYL